MRCTAAGQPHGVLSCSCFQETNWWLQRGRGGTGGIERQKGPGGGFRLPMHVPEVGAIQRCMGTTSPSHSASLMTHVARGFPSKHTCKAPLPVPKQGGGLLDAASGLCFFFHLAFGTKPGPEIFLSVTVAFTVPSWRKQGPPATWLYTLVGVQPCWVFSKNLLFLQECYGWACLQRELLLRCEREPWISLWPRKSAAGRCLHCESCSTVMNMNLFWESQHFLGKMEE